MRLMVLNPFGVAYMDAPTQDLVGRHVADDTDLECRSLGDLAPPYPWPGADVMPLMLDQVKQAASEGFDAVLVACSGDPFVRQLRNHVPIPVVGVTETVLAEARTRGKVQILPRLLPPAFRPLIPMQGSHGFWHDLAISNDLTEDDYAISTVDIPEHPEPGEMLDMARRDPRGLGELMFTCMTEGLMADGVVKGRAASTAGANTLYYSCVFYSAGIDALRGDTSAFGADVVNPLAVAAHRAEQLALVAG